MFTYQPMWHNVLAFFAADAEGGSGGSGGSSGSGDQGSDAQGSGDQGSGDRGSGAQGSGASADDSTDHGFPKDTPTDQMTVEQREAYWRYHARKHEKRAKEREDYDKIKRERDELKAASLTEAEKAIEDARKEARAEADKEWAEKLARSELRGILAGRGMEDEKLEAALTFVDFKQFLDDNGDVDSVKVQRYSDTVAPQNSGHHGHWPDVGQGNRDMYNGRRPGGSVDAGRDAFKSRRTKNSDSNRSGVGNA